jgi:hypothetical protein
VRTLYAVSGEHDPLVLSGSNHPPSWDTSTSSQTATRQACSIQVSSSVPIPCTQGGCYPMTQGKPPQSQSVRPDLSTPCDCRTYAGPEAV